MEYDFVWYENKVEKIVDALLNSLKDSDVSPKQKTTKEQGVEACSLAHNNLEG